MIAQSTAQIPLQFDFMNPGARSLGLGGAFIGAADDATAAFANPAGLALLTTREVSGEGRFRRVETRFLEGGRLSGNITGIGLDTVAHAIYGTDVDSEFGPTFLSFLIPLKRVTVAAYRHELATIDHSLSYLGAFDRATFNSVTNDLSRDAPLTGRRTIRIRNYGAAIGYKVNERLSIGGGMSVYTFDVRSDFAQFGFVSGVLSEIDFTRARATVTQRGNDASFSGNLGVLWSVAPRLKVGGTFRRGPRLMFVQEDRDLLSDVELNRTGRFKVPDVWGAGVEWRVGEHLRIVGDYDRVQYSQLKADFINFQAISTGREDQLRIDDGHEAHVGVERLFLETAVPMAVRLGAWFDPDHAVRYVPNAQNDQIDIRLTAKLPGGKNLMHYTFGGGFAFARWLEVNLAADLSSRTRYATASTVVRF